MTDQGYTPTRQEARSRQTAMDSERHWFVSRLKRFRTDWHTFGRRQPTSDYDRGYRDACMNCAGALDALIAERERP